MDEDKVYLLIEEAIELFDEVFDEDKSFQSTVNYEGCQITATGNNGKYLLAFECEVASSDYSFTDPDEELDVELIFTEIVKELE